MKTLAPELLASRHAWLSQTKQRQIRELERDPTLAYEWHLWARDNQITPDGDWITWLILAGRGFGKTRTGAEWMRQEIRRSAHVNLIGATVDDARDIMIEGESGILAICPRQERPEYISHKRKLVWPNGNTSLIFTADEPERLRGKQHSALWADELAAWRYPEAWDQAQFGLRLGTAPRAVVTTTPRPTKLIKQLVKDPTTHVTRGSTFDNRGNLAATFVKTIVGKYEGTRLGRQELNAEILEDNPGALWQRSNIDAHRRRAGDVPVMRRIVVAIDPAVTSSEESDETGIIAAGLGEDGRGYVLRDVTVKGTPNEWATAALKMYHQLKADRLVAEVNNGGDLVETIIRNIDATVSYQAVHASRGKFSRAEPVSALYEQGRVSHVGSFPELEDQMCDFDPISAKRSPDRMDALVWALTALMLAENTFGMLEWMEQEARAAAERRTQQEKEHGHAPIVTPAGFFGRT